MGASDFTRKKAIAPQPGASQLSAIYDSLKGGSDSLVAKAVGYSEGTRDIDGGYNKAWFAHTDPGNGALNQGSFSFQHKAASPEDADKQQIRKFEVNLLPKFQKALDGTKLSSKDLLKLWVISCDVYTQSEAACLLEGGFLYQLENKLPVGAEISLKKLVDMRLSSYYDPKTGKLDAPGFGNDLARVQADQRRRTEAVLAVLEAIQ